MVFMITRAPWDMSGAVYAGNVTSLCFDPVVMYLAD